LKVGGLLLPLGRIVRVEFQWSYFTERFTGLVGRRGTVQVNSQRAEQYVYSGNGVVCFKYGDNAAISSGSSAWSFKQVGTDVDQIDDSGNDGGPDAFIYPPTNQVAIPAIVPPTNYLQPDYDLTHGFWPQYGGPIGPAYDVRLCQYSEDETRTAGRGGVFGIYNARSVYNYRFEDGGSIGSVVGSSNWNSTDTRTSAIGIVGTATQRQIDMWAIQWKRTILTCNVGGDTGQSLSREPGCSNCFDPSLLEPM